MRVFLFALPILLTVACGKTSEVDLDVLESPSNRSLIVTSDYPAVVMVVMPGGQGICTGTFVSPRTVLTAAHCTLEEGTYTVVSSFGMFRTRVKRNFGPGTLQDPEDLALLVFSSAVANPRKGQVIAVGSQPDLAEKVRLVGFGCNDLETRLGTGVKRTGTNQVAKVGDYLELYTPRVAVTAAASTRGLLGSDNRTGTCFGDSGGPLLRWSNGSWGVSAVSHAGGVHGDGFASAFVNVNRVTNFDFLRNTDADLELGLFDTCQTSVSPALSCQVEFASAQIEKFIRVMLHWIGWF